ncbi:AAA family ATPase [Sphingobacterium sp.]|uniref:AAA family ATPase n=1 Tax=Sphingobacterium sp. TaxID=341027 RepID=UPI002587775B|nr:AAA family ATPase [Sphingobacterium sp.]WET69108.1 MAG: AAA family ATPase [Sphingobacterium sp.]
MRTLELNKFKAFKDPISLNLDGKSLLMYGENGSGKSSLYEAIKLTFFSLKLQGNLSAATPEDLEQQKNDLLSKYNNKVDNQNFSIKINGTEYDSFIRSNYQVFMISLEELFIDNKINIKELLRSFFLDITDIDIICQQAAKLIEQEVNEKLNSFSESVRIEIDEEDDYSLKIIDDSRNISSTTELRKFFNEGKINAIVLLVLLTAIELSKDPTKENKILVLDDFITSLDVSNRTFLIKLIIENFADTQVIILTHNISFYNLIMFMINKIRSKPKKKTESSEWLFCNLYEINNCHKIYFKNNIERVKTIKEDYGKLGTANSNVEIDAIGNRIRRKFEILLYEYSKLLMIGTVEDSSKIIDRIMNGKAAYYNSEGKTASDLIDDLEVILQQNIAHNLPRRLQNKIDSYKNHSFSNFKKIITELKLYQKVTMHPLSHGIAGIPTFTTREIEKSIDLLEKMEDFLRDMVDSNVSGV